MTLIKLPKMSKKEINNLIKEQFLCRIAFGGKLAPYVAPFQYVSVKDHLYFHFTDYGKKMNFLEEKVPVCVEIEQFTQNLSIYHFIVLTGKLELVTNPEERDKALKEMAKTAQERQLSTDFLHAHGISKEAGWSALTKEKSLIVIKLVDITSTIGLKSP